MDSWGPEPALAAAAVVEEVVEAEDPATSVVADSRCSGPSIPGTEGTGSGYTVVTQVQYVDNTPELLELVIPVQAEWLKEFYDVSMTVTNLGSSGFTLTGGSAQLEPARGPRRFEPPGPAGALRPGPAGAPERCRTSPGVVGNRLTGSFGVTKRGTGTSPPATAPRSTRWGCPCRSRRPIRTRSTSGASRPSNSPSARDATATVREPYAVTVSITNVTDSDPGDSIPLFNVGLQFLTQGAINFVYQPDQQMSTSTPELDPGKTLSLSGILYPDLSGDLLPNLSYVTEKEAGGAVDNTAVISAQPDQGARLTASAKGKPGGVQLKWQAVPGATGYQIWSTAGWPNPIPNPPDLSLTQFGGSPLATVGAVTKDTITGLPGNTTSEYAIVPLVNGTPENVENQLVEAATGASPVSITSFSPQSGAVGAKVTITGKGLTGATLVDVQRGEGKDQLRYRHPDRGQGSLGGNHRTDHGADTEGQCHVGLQLHGELRRLDVVRREALTPGPKGMIGRGTPPATGRAGSCHNRRVDVFRDRVGVVTGAASGIGLALVEAFVAEGMRVVMADIDETALDGGVASGSARPWFPFVVDVRDQGSVERAGQLAIEAFGALHVAVNNAGIVNGGNSWELPLEDWHRVIDTNLWGVIHGVRAFVPLILASGEEGHVVNTSSMAAVLALPGIGPYTVAKHGVLGLSDVLRAELAAMDAPVGVSVVMPGMIRTGMNPVGIVEPSRWREMCSTPFGEDDPTCSPTTTAPERLTARLRAILAAREDVLT